MHTTLKLSRLATHSVEYRRVWMAFALAAIVLVPAGGLLQCAGAQASVLEQGARLFTQGKLDEATSVLAPSGRTSFPAALLLGRIAYREHHTDDAIRWLEGAVDLAGDSSAAHLWLARAYVQAIPQASFIRQPILARRARSQFDRALELEPSSVDAHEDRAIFYMYSPALFGGGMTNARAEADVVRTLNAYRGALLRAEIETHAQKLEAAEGEYVRLMASYPDSAAPFNRLLALYQTSGRYADAFAAVDARRAAHRDDIWMLYQLGRTAAFSGQRLDEGEVALRKFIGAGSAQSTTFEASARYRLGMILEQRHDAASARAEYDTAVRLDPTLEDAKRALRRVAP